MGSFEFRLEFVEALARHRTPLLTDFFAAMSDIGGEGFYLLLVLLFYVAWDKRLAVRLSFIVMITMACNALLKVLIHNPRPFVLDGTYRQRWAVSPDEAASLAGEYATPSGHAMSAGGFYTYLYASVRNVWVRVAAVLLILLIGFSRPYLGVHYVEDMLLGWSLGLGIALVAVRYKKAMQNIWARRSFPVQIGIAVAGSVAILAVSAALNGWQSGGQTHGLAAFGGFFTGTVIAAGLEQRIVRFDAGRGSLTEKCARFLVVIGLIAAVIVPGKAFVSFLVLGDSILRLSMVFVGYAAASVTGMFVAPLLFTRLKLAVTEAADSGESEIENAESRSRQEA
jgi:membrane-associated phospholipid phosphatase